MSFKIVVNYGTGDSFHRSPDQEYIIPMSWESDQKAKENLKRIEAHYKLYLSIEQNTDLDQKEYKKLLNKAKTQPWFHDVPGRVDFWQWTVILEDDNGNPFETGTGTWIGYFESLNYAEIRSEATRYTPKNRFF